MSINNEIYSQQAGGWWDENHFLHLLKTGMNPPALDISMMRSPGSWDDNPGIYPCWMWAAAVES